MKLLACPIWIRMELIALTVSFGFAITIPSNNESGLRADDKSITEKSPAKKSSVTKSSATKSAGKKSTATKKDSETSENEKSVTEGGSAATAPNDAESNERPAASKPVLKRIVRTPAAAKVAEPETASTEPETGTVGGSTEESAKSKLPLEVPTHEQVATIAINQPSPSGCTLNTFCLTNDGRIIAAVQCATARRTAVSTPKPATNPDAEAAGTDNKESDGVTSGETRKSPPTTLGELRFFDSDGKALGVWPLEINPSTVNAGSDGSIYVAGSGKVMKLDAQGKVLLTIDAPSTKELFDNREAILKEMQAQTAGAGRSKEMFANAITQAKKRIAELEKKEAVAKQEEKELTRSDKVRLTSARRSLQSMEEALASLREPTEEEKAAQFNAAMESKKRISGIAVTENDVFVSCSSAIGWGYDVWRLDRDLGNATKVVEKLRGCCGQMDIQARGENLVVAENSMHRVSCYDRTGKLIKHFGERESIAKLGFEGCCNPMNCRLGAEGEIYTSESSIGRIRKYSADGKYIGLVGKAKLISGCKHVAVAVSQDASKVYLLDVTKGEILVMAKAEADTTAN